METKFDKLQSLNTRIVHYRNLLRMYDSPVLSAYESVAIRLRLLFFNPDYTKDTIIEKSLEGLILSKEHKYFKEFLEGRLKDLEEEFNALNV